jgi:hypothetical protein
MNRKTFPSSAINLYYIIISSTETQIMSKPPEATGNIRINKKNQIYILLILKVRNINYIITFFFLIQLRIGGCICLK